VTEQAETRRAEGLAPLRDCVAEWLEAYQGPRPLRGQPRYAERPGRCAVCGGAIKPGELYLWSNEYHRGGHVGCATLEHKSTR
jgi:hypothetical protein